MLLWLVGFYIRMLWSCTCWHHLHVHFLHNCKFYTSGLNILFRLGRNLCFAQIHHFIQHDSLHHRLRHFFAAESSRKNAVLWPASIQLFDPLYDVSDLVGFD